MDLIKIYKIVQAISIIIRYQISNLYDEIIEIVGSRQPGKYDNVMPPSNHVILTTLV